MHRDPMPQITSPDAVIIQYPPTINVFRDMGYMIICFACRKDIHDQSTYTEILDENHQISLVVENLTNHFMIKDIFGVTQFYCNRGEDPNYSFVYTHDQMYVGHFVLYCPGYTDLFVVG